MNGNHLPSAWVIPPVVGGVFFQIQYYLYSNVIYYYKKSKYVMFGSILAALLNLVLNYICIKKFGYIAAAFTTLGCYFVQALIDYLAMRHVAKQSIYNLYFILALSAIVTCVSIFGSYITHSKNAICCSFIVKIYNYRQIVKQNLQYIAEIEKNSPYNRNNLATKMSWRFLLLSMTAWTTTSSQFLENLFSRLYTPSLNILF